MNKYNYNILRHHKGVAQGYKGGGNAPFHYLVIGGSNLNSYGGMFFEVGDHKSANYGKGRNWFDNNFWPELHTYLTGQKASFDAIFFDSGSFSWLDHNDTDLKERDRKNTNIFNRIIDIFQTFLAKNGIIIIEAYNAASVGLNVPVAKFCHLMMSRCALGGYREFVLNDDNFGVVYRIFQKYGDDFTISNKKIPKITKG